LFQTFTHCGTSGDFEGQNRRVDVVEGTVNQRNLEVDNREASERNRVHDRLDALLDAGAVFLRNSTTNYARFERIAFAGLGRTDLEFDARELAGTTGLFLVRVVDVRRLRDGLAVGHLRSADVRLDFELAT